MREEKEIGFGFGFGSRGKKGILNVITTVAKKRKKQERERKLGFLSRVSPPKSLETLASSTSGF